MNFRLLLAYVLVFAMAVTGVDATAQRRASTKSRTRTTTVKSSASLPNALGRDTYTMIKRDVTLKYTGSDKSGMTPSYKSYDIDIKWPTDLRLANTGGSGALAEMDNHKGGVFRKFRRSLSTRFLTNTALLTLKRKLTILPQ